MYHTSCCMNEIILLNAIYGHIDCEQCETTSFLQAHHSTNRFSTLSMATTICPHSFALLVHRMFDPWSHARAACEHHPTRIARRFRTMVAADQGLHDMLQPLGNP
eukprot:m.263303 g.263303  ORF g.263303 m.263303 type:complete len:105 (-) comp19706_c0_seq32:275-589(-)